MADYGSYDSGTGDVISAIQRPAVVVGQAPNPNVMSPTDVTFVGEQPYMGGQPVNIPGFGGPSGDDLINSAIARRQQIEQQRYDLSRRLEGATRRQAPSIISQIQGLDLAAHGAMADAALGTRMKLDQADQLRMAAHEDAMTAARALKTDREHSIDEQGAALMTGLGRLDALHRSGNISSEEYDAGLLDLGQQYGLGLRHPDAGKMYEHYVGEADRRNQFNLRRTAAEAARVGARYGVDVQTDEYGNPSIEATKAVALQTPRGRSEALKQMGDELYQKYGNPLGVNSLFNPIVPHTSPDNGKTINLPYADKKTGKLAAMNVPMDTFNQMKADFQDRYFSLFPPAAPTSSPSQPEAQSGGLQVGTQRTIGGVPAVWDGQGWKRAQ